MLIEEAVYAIGQANSALGALIGTGTNMRLFPEAEDQEHVTPRVIYEKDTPTPIAGIHKDSGWYKTRIRFRAYADTALLAKQLIEACRACWQRWNSYDNGPVVVGPSSMTIEDATATGWGAADRDYDLAQYWEEFELQFFYKSLS